MLFVHPVHEKWQKGMPDIEHSLENKVDIVPGSGFPSDGIAFHLVTPQNWKRFSIPEASAVLSLFGESSEASSDGILLGHASSEYHRRTDR